VTIDETLAASRRLDDVLKEAIEMPEIGGKKLSGEFGEMLAGVRRMIDETKLDIAAAVSELTTEVRGGKQVAKALREEAAHVRSAFGAVLGNDPGAAEDKGIADDLAGKPNGGDSTGRAP
jgi:hypothetical protein